MAINTTNFSEAIEPLIREWYGAEYDQHPEIFSKVYDVKTTGKKYEYLHSMAGFGLVPVKPEGSPISYVDSKQGYKTTITQVTYALGFPVTLEMMKFNMYNLVESMARALGVSMKQTIETVAADLFNNGFDSNYTFADGKELFATDHPKLYGGTWQNEPTTAVDLSLDALEQAKLDINDYPTDRGLLIAARPKLLHIPPELEWTAKQLLLSDKDPETANNAINPAKGMMDYVVNPYLTDPDAWYVKTTVGNGTQFFWSQKPEHTMDNDTDSLNLKKKVHAMFAVSCGDPRSWYGSPGI
jgi:hypothetical protein